MLLELAFSPLEFRRVIAAVAVTLALLPMVAWGLERFARHPSVLVRAVMIAFPVLAPLAVRVVFGRLGMDWNTYLIPLGLGLAWLYRALKPVPPLPVKG